MYAILVAAVVSVAVAPYAALWLGWRTEWNRQQGPARHRRRWGAR